MISKIKKIFWLASSLLLFFLFIEVLRAYQTLAEFHFLAGWGFIVVLAGLFIWAIFAVLRVFSNQRALKIPKESASAKKRLKYLQKYADRLLKNPNLQVSQRDNLQNHFAEIMQKTIESEQKTINLKEQIIEPSLDLLNESADKICRNAVRDVMLGVMLSPFRAMDVLIVINRNWKMLRELVDLYHQRPAMADVFRYTLDVGKIVITVNILNFSEVVTKYVLKSVPGFGQVADDILQGLGAGVVTSAVGDLTIKRCRAYSEWDLEKEKQKWKKSLGTFFKRAIFIFTKDVIPDAPIAFRKVWEKISKKLIPSDKENNKNSWLSFFNRESKKN